MSFIWHNLNGKLNLTPASSALKRCIPLQKERLRTRFFYSSDEADETPEEFTRKWVNFFDSAPDLFEVQRGLNITFGGDIVPTGPIVAAALRAARRYDDFPTTVRVFAGLRGKLPKKTQYEAYLKALSDEMNEIGAATPEELNQ